METRIKRKSRLAVFEHISERQESPKRKKFHPNRLELDDSSPSESELVIDDEIEPVRKKKRPVLIKLSEEPLSLKCEWNFCHEIHNSWEKLDRHFTQHVSKLENLTCLWLNCKTVLSTRELLIQHLSYHGYLSKLKNIGQNELDRKNWPECKQEEKFKIPISPEGFTCLWEHCSYTFFTIFDFYTHMNMHIHNNPRVTNEAKNEVIKCGWQACNTKFSTKYKLANHIRTHTKEKVVACPTCCTQFSNKTKFCDHRKKQLSTDLQSYQCSQCLKLFPTERLLRDHMRSHINHYKCTMCDMTCTKPSMLAKHMRFKHIKAKPFQCPSCPKRFVAKHILVTHLRVHREEDFLKCELCDFGCRDRHTLNNHYEKMHGKACPVYQCHCCKKKFRRGAYLTKHLMKLHNYHWPSGHSRFQYRKDQDGIHRLQTVRYESLEVTQEMLEGHASLSNTPDPNATYKLQSKGDGHFAITMDKEDISKEEEDEKNNILITITDVDEQGNVVRTEVVKSEPVTKVMIKEAEAVEEISDHKLRSMREEPRIVEGISGEVGNDEKGNGQGLSLEGDVEGGTQCGSDRRRRRKRKRKAVKVEKMEDVEDKEDVRYFSEVGIKKGEF